MKIAFPTNNQKTISSHIGLAKGFLIVDTDTNERLYIQNPIIEKLNRTYEKRGLRIGRVIPHLLKEAGVEAIVAIEFGEGMVRNLEFEGIKPFISKEKQIEKVLSNLDSLTAQESYIKRSLGRCRRERGYW
jgi:predicted Fe-Mo cluster-binding NifX family protein